LQQWNFIGGYFWSVGPVPFDTSCFYPPINRPIYWLMEPLLMSVFFVVDDKTEIGVD